MYVYMYTKLHRHIIILNIDRERQCSAQHNIIVADCECDEGNWNNNNGLWKDR